MLRASDGVIESSSQFNLARVTDASAPSIPDTAAFANATRGEIVPFTSTITMPRKRGTQARAGTGVAPREITA